MISKEIDLDKVGLLTCSNNASTYLLA